MKNTNKFFFYFCLSVVLCICFAANVAAQKTVQKVPSEVQAIVGNFVGVWTSYTINSKGEVVKQATWKDVIKAEKPTLEKDRAFVETIDEMTFEGGRIPPQKVVGKEGYLLNKDGSLGDYFVEIFGQTVSMKKLSDNVFAYTVPANSREFAALGDKFISANHVLVKVTTFEKGVEIHNITRLTTVRWTDTEDKERLTQFVSLQGQHKKSK